MVRKVGVVGCGNVGSAAAFSIVNQQIAEQLTLVDILKAKANGDALDLQDSMVLKPGYTDVSATVIKQAINVIKVKENS
ncbi:hypothetical protein FZC66_06880 [Priestia megaterium]|nr:hypothetical protein FZC66_06880 [Priestia megaterium]